ncbi:MAG TPA: cache domain-containing protein [Syntrophorhabdaceae bacterium]|jgi:signal transduction histidine kinase
MKKAVWSMVVVLAVVFGAAYVVQAAPLDDAKTLAEKSAAYVKANGKEKGIAEIANPKGQFVKGDLYVTLQDFNGIALANPMNPKLHGQNHLELKDATGKTFIKENIEVAKTKGSGWVTYSWTNPATKKIQAKKAWVQRVEGTDMYTMSGVFQ